MALIRFIASNCRKLTKLGNVTPHRPNNFMKVVTRCGSFGPDYLVDPSAYDKVYHRSLENPEEFWAELAEDIVWNKKWNKVLDNSNPPFTKWFVGGEMNTCYNAVDRHVENGFGDQTAIIHDSPVTDTIQSLTYRELQKQVSALAGAMSAHGVGRGDRVLIYMPMIPQAVVAMLAAARLGAVHSLVFGGFASRELATRINHAQPKMVVSANCGQEPGKVIDYKKLLDDAIVLSDHKPEKCLIYTRRHVQFPAAPMKAGRDLDYEEELAAARPHDAVPVLATDPVYLLYTSGTTGTPKAVVRPSGGHAVTLKWSMYNIYGVHPHETWFAASDLGWVVGHSYIVYAPLLNCNTTVLYEGKPVGTPDPSAYYRMIEQHGIVSMFVAPTAMRALRREDSEGAYAKPYDTSHFRYMFVAGEHCDFETLEWIRGRFRVPTLDNWWQTETGSAITATNVGLGNHLYPPPSVAGRPVPGWDLRLIGGSHDPEVPKHGDLGNIVAKLPLPPSCLSTLWRNDELFEQLYFTKYPGFYDTSDAGEIADGYVAVMSRTDDVINTAGHRLSTGQLEEACLMHGAVAEAAVVGMPDSEKGQKPLGLCVLKSGLVQAEAEIVAEVKAAVRQHVGAVAAFKDCVIVHRLPKTRSGKVARNTLAAMVAGKPYKIPVTISDATVYPELEQTLAEQGYMPSNDPSKSE